VIDEAPQTVDRVLRKLSGNVIERLPAR
jgi:hypothetical protein